MGSRWFTPEERERVRDRVLATARSDARVVAGAIVGSHAHGGGDRWSDLDLTFGLSDGARPRQVLDDWTRALAELEPAHLFDLPFRSSLYRVFLFPGNLQVDVSCTPAAEFGALGPQFELLFGTSVEREPPPKASAAELFGIGVHHLVRARICVERGRLLEAEQLIHLTRDQALALACLARGLEPRYGRGFDRLPEELRSRAEAALACAFGAPELLRALGETAELLLETGEGSGGPVTAVAEGLRGLAAPLPGAAEP